MVYYNILGIFIIRGVGGFIIRGRGLARGMDQAASHCSIRMARHPYVNLFSELLCRTCRIGASRKGFRLTIVTPGQLFSTKPSCGTKCSYTSGLV